MNRGGERVGEGYNGCKGSSAGIDANTHEPGVKGATRKEKMKGQCKMRGGRAASAAYLLEEVRRTNWSCLYASNCIPGKGMQHAIASDAGGK